MTASIPWASRAVTLRRVPCVELECRIVSPDPLSFFSTRDETPCDSLIGANSAFFFRFTQFAHGTDTNRSWSSILETRDVIDHHERDRVEIVHSIKHGLHKLNLKASEAPCKSASWDQPLRRVALPRPQLPIVALPIPSRSETGCRR